MHLEMPAQLHIKSLRCIASEIGLAMRILA